MVAQPTGWSQETYPIAAEPTLLLENLTDEEQLFILEEAGWADDAVVAAEVSRHAAVP
ncbi:MAG: hypothetical protein M5U34_46320 [Chloroflexi bacterium]|nr:hypothetical protein [Chloroflexota bacterium]